MGLISRFYQNLVTRVASDVATQVRLASLENPNTPLSAVFDEPKSTTGIVVTETGSLSIGAVYSCVKVVSETFGIMDLDVMKKSGKFKQYDPNHDVNRILRDPSQNFNSFQWKQTMAMHVLLWGNGYTEIIRNRFAEPLEFKILQPHEVTVKITNRGRIFYEHRAADGSFRIIIAENMLHFKNLSIDGLLGLSTVAIQRDSMANAIAKTQHEGAFYVNGAKASGIIMTPGSMGKTERGNIENSFEKAHSGAQNRFKTIILEEGVKYQQLTIPQNDAQFLESKNYDRSEIAGWFRVPPYKIGYMDNANYSNVEAQERSFARDAIVPLAINMQNEIDRKLFFEEERGTWSTQFNFDDITKGDMKTRYEAWGQGIQNGFIKPKDAAEAEGWDTNGHPELDQYYMNGTMMPVKTILMKPAEPTKPEPGGQNEEKEEKKEEAA